MKIATTTAIVTLLVTSPLLAGELVIDPHLTVINHNGAEQRGHTEILPIQEGPQTLFVRFEQIYDYSAESHEIVRSKVFLIRFNAEMDQQYRLVVPDANSFNVDDAHAFILNPTFRIDTGANQVVAHQHWNQAELLAKLLGDATNL